MVCHTVFVAEVGDLHGGFSPVTWRCVFGVGVKDSDVGGLVEETGHDAAVPVLAIGVGLQNQVEIELVTLRGQPQF